MSKLVINRLKITHETKNLVDVSFEIKEATALIGQSGSGKSLTLKALLGLLPQNLKHELNIDAPFSMDKHNVGFVPQNPFTSLSPMTKIKDQFFCANARKLELLELVGLESWVLERFPSQLSGGQLQRVVIGIALTHSPKLLLLDEPTTALDSKSKNVIIQLLKTIQSKLKLYVLFVTHDINSIIDICEYLIIINNGNIVETGLTQEVLSHPKDTYTQKLIASGFNTRTFRT